MPKKDFNNAIMRQTAEKEKSLLETKVGNFESENKQLREKVKQLEAKNLTSNDDVSVLKLSQIKIRENIRDNYETEEIDELANEIKRTGQLQPVLLSKDNYLLAGYRRYYAMKSLSPDYDVLVYRLVKSSSEINETELKDIQFAENSQRRPIDNFQLSNLMHWYLKQGYSQNDLADKFKKPKSLISEILVINKIDPELVKYLKEFQIYGVSQKKFGAPNSDPEKNLKLLEKKGIIGVRSLYKIAKLPSKEQKRAFLKNYGKLLSEEELNSKFFQKDRDVLEKTGPKNKFEKALNSVSSLKELLEKISDSKDKDLQAAANHILELERIFTKKAEKN